MNNYIERIELEFEEFKKIMLDKTPQEIFDNCGKIYFYEEVKDYLINSGIELNDDITLKALYDLYITDMNSYYSVGCWDDIDVFVRAAINEINNKR